MNERTFFVVGDEVETLKVIEGPDEDPIITAADRFIKHRYAGTKGIIKAAENNLLYVMHNQVIGVYRRDEVFKREK